MNSIWQPTATLDTLHQRAVILAKIREFFAARNVLEVETPLLSSATVTDIHLHSLTTQCTVPGQSQAQTHYLQTSPEFAMKRLLAAGSGCIYQMCKAFRDDEVGKRHNPEFTILEWYRVGFDHHQLMDEMDLFLQTLIQSQPAQRISYQALFLKYCDVDPHNTSLQTLEKTIAAHDITLPMNLNSNFKKDTYLEILMSHLIEPQLGFDSPVFIYDYPATQSGLACIRKDKVDVAERFEVYVNGIELANGYHELCDADEQAQRFKKDLAAREQLGLPLPVIDTHLLAALQSGMPACAGVALGVDRLVMIATNKSSIAEVLAFVT